MLLNILIYGMYVGCNGIVTRGKERKVYKNSLIKRKIPLTKLL